MIVEDKNISLESGSKERLATMIHVLSGGYDSVISVNRQTKDLTYYKNSENCIAFGKYEKTPDKTYEEILEGYVIRFVADSDKDLVRDFLNFDTVLKNMSERETDHIHFRVAFDDETHYYTLRITRDNDAENYENILLLFRCEDEALQAHMPEHAFLPGEDPKRKILIIDDDKENRTELKKLLENDYDLIEAENGQEGFNILQSQFQSVSGVLLKVGTPVINSYNFLEKIKQDPFLRNIPTIAMTESGSHEIDEKCISLGATEILTKPYNPTLVKLRVSTMVQMREALAALTTIEYDEVTHLYTKQAFKHYAEMLLRNNPDKRYDVVAYCINNFRMINEVYSFSIGDDLLRYVNDVVRNTFKDGIYSRYSGSKFTCMIPHTSEEKLRQMTAEIKEALVNSPVPTASLKFGVYQDVEHDLSITSIYDCARSAQDTIRKNYDSIIAFYDEEGRKQIEAQQMMEASFEKAIREKQFVVYYQPKLDPYTNKIVGAEGLVRWQQKDGTLITPDHFIPLFEKDSLIIRLDAYMFRAICEEQKRMMDMGLNIVPISINLSRNSLVRNELLEEYMQIIKETGVSIESVPIELTESSAFLVSQIKGFADKLKDAGFSLHMDDLGNGYSSLISLHMLSFDVVKIDKSLTDYIGNSEGDAIIKHTIALARELSMKVVIEGVETAEQVEFLKELGCDAIQGFYYSKPVPQEDFEKMIAQNSLN